VKKSAPGKRKKRQNPIQEEESDKESSLMIAGLGKKQLGLSCRKKKRIERTLRISGKKKGGMVKSPT